jgi:hypothetical protein
MLPSKKSIRQIPLPSNDYKRPNFEEKEDDQRMLKNMNINNKEKKSSFWIWLIVIIVIIAILIPVSYIFSGATISVTPKIVQTTISSSFTAYPSGGTGDIQYDILSLNQELAEEADATGEEEILKKSSGEIVIYNNYDTSPQRLIKNTRFESREGLIYQIQNSVVVPGGTEENGGTLKPGSVEVTVFAGEAGEQYNIGLTNFTVPGFEDDAPRFKGFYAESKTEMVGGFSGTVPTVDEDEEESIREELRDQLRTALLSEANGSMHEEFILNEDNISFTFDSLPNEAISGDRVLIKEKGTIRGAMIKKSSLARMVASNTIADYDGAEVFFKNPNDFNIDFMEDGVVGENIEIDVSGQGNIVWMFDANQLVEDLKSKSKRSVGTVLTGYPGIEKVEVVIRPFWLGTFPKKAEKIKVKDLSQIEM